MRGRVTLAGTLAAGAILLGAGGAVAQHAEPHDDQEVDDRPMADDRPVEDDDEQPGGQLLGGDGTAVGEILAGGSGAGVTAAAPGSGSGGTGGSDPAGGGGTGPRRRCDLYENGPLHVALAMGNRPLTIDELTAEHERTGQPVQVFRICTQGGRIVSTADTLWAPPATGGPVEPVELAELAREEIVWPAPVVAMSPPLEHGTYAQLWTFFSVTNWAPVTSPPAVAGDVWATVTATPVSQSWVIRDSHRGTSETVTCDGPGALFDQSRPYEAQTPPPCGWLPRHSSAGQTQTSPYTGEPCFPASVTVTWDVTWTSNVDPGGSLGQGTSTTTLCLVTAELQATVVGPSGT